ncbi:MAG: RNA-binding S4 domain-containing protein [Alphaproteobacteria bacterium]|jgi:ribosomal 50S subunit-recycling heat shock protein|nr:RNA-binding S4 domain-containing protein [Alphaproteobacteria bacterium]
MSAETEAEGCRVDVWLWRARLSKTRALAARLAETGRIRLEREGRSNRLDKPSRRLKVGDALVFALGGRLIHVRVAALGVRRGPPAEARSLYVDIPLDPAPTVAGQAEH